MAKNDVAKIKSVIRQVNAAYNTNDIGALQKTLANDFVFMPPDAPKVAGKKAFTGWAKETFFDPYTMKLRLKPHRVHVLGSEAFAPGSFSLSLTPKSGGSTTTGVGKFIHGFKKQKDGSWKYAQVIFNYDKPPA